ncbi:iron complex outermembrane receptor protein [Pseudoduganella lurida]|uniref:Iron complex outermembrane receptor protein n=1 Tax=Pseudoduganella lurida TaxID=1036180 RepID=A0A562RE46_9BURK|nr:TonB-dependent receptor [Pseudoduganella lurida]TWI67335.1 iron complex outermembrane receptor protein [Pseudoduganella lurida]
MTEHVHHAAQQRSSRKAPQYPITRTAIAAGAAMLCFASGMAAANGNAVAVAVAAIDPVALAAAEAPAVAAEASGEAQAAVAGTSAAAVVSDGDVVGTMAGAVHIRGKALNGATKAKLRLEEVPGGVSVVSAEQVEKGRVFTSEDVLAFQPGVYAQAAGGTDGIKISIRGSAINRGTNFFRSGTLFLFDGLPVTGPGGTPYELFEPLGLSRTEILRGANAFDQGALMLGGAINYVTRTGHDAAAFEARVEAGSFGYKKVSVSSGQVIGNWDYYVQAIASERDGYQTLSSGESRAFIGNLGYKFGPDVETRFYFRYRKTDNYQPGALTVAQVEQDPRQANPTSVAQDAHRNQPGSRWLANKTLWNIDGDSSLEFGAVIHDYPIDQQLGVNVGSWGFTDLSFSLNYQRRETLFGLRSETKLGALSTSHNNHGWLDTRVRIPSGATAGLPVGTLIRRAEYDGEDHILHAGNDLEIARDLWLTTGVSGVKTKRFTEVVYPVVNEPYARSTTALAPRAGLRYTFPNEVQVFGNVSRSIEPPNSWAFLTTPPAFTTGPATGLSRHGLDLKDQTANTFELGTRGAAYGSNWSLSVYRSYVKNELLSVEVVPATATTAAATAESNATPTIHQGIEAGLESRLWDGGANGTLAARQSFTLNDFYFRGDSRFGRNTLPGIPKRFYQGELSYEHPSGFYGGLSVQAASRIDVDYANSFRTHGYGIVNASFGYEHPTQGWKLFVDLRNLADKHYVSSVSPAYNDAGTDQRRSAPGEGFAVYSGLQYAFK